MSRFLKRSRSSGFRMSDILRLMAMIGMLGVLGMTFFQFRDAQMWRWLIRQWEPSQGAEADEQARLKQVDSQSAAVAAQMKAQGVEVKTESTNPKRERGIAENPSDVVVTAVEPAAPGSSDSDSPSLALRVSNSKTLAQAAPAPDANNPAPIKRSELVPEEKERLKQELELIEDKAPLSAFEMGAYWRLVTWVQDQTSEEMDQRARRDIIFTHLWERPSQYRGQLVRLKLHMVRSLRYETEKNRAGVDWLYEAWGTTNDSASNPYCVVFTEWPKGMPLGEGLEEDATVEGYFLKLMRYESRDGKRRSAPLLIGRLHWHKNPVNTSQNSTNIIWSGLVIVCGVVVFGLGVWVFRFMFGSPKLAAVTPSVLESEDVGDWLTQNESDESYQESEPVLPKS